MGRKSKDQKWREAISKAVTKLTPEVVAKLKQAFAIGASPEQACYYAEIHVVTYYRWIKKYPELRKEFALMKQRLPLAAKTNIASAIETLKDIGLSKWLLERKEPDEFGETLNINTTGEVNIGSHTPPEDQEAIIAMRNTLKENMLKRRTALAKEKGEIPS